tara:strand:- start:202 stop:432 length:231 start_codon:yes stop_codon:yes gene_type:complete
MRRKAPRFRNEVTRSFRAVFAFGKKFLSEVPFSLVLSFGQCKRNEQEELGAPRFFCFFFHQWKKERKEKNRKKECS